MLRVMDMKFPLKGHRTFPESEPSQSKAKIFKTWISIGVGRGRVRSNQTIFNGKSMDIFWKKHNQFVIIWFDLFWTSVRIHVLVDISFVALLHQVIKVQTICNCPINMFHLQDITIAETWGHWGEFRILIRLKI